MTKARILLVCLVLLAVGAAMRVLLWHPFTVIGPQPPDAGRRASEPYMYTHHSDGVGDVDEIVAAAKRARLDFVIITDHNDFDLKSRERYSDGVLVIVGTEIPLVPAMCSASAFPSRHSVSPTMPLKCSRTWITLAASRWSRIP